jgi:hypothetical protein
MFRKAFSRRGIVVAAGVFVVCALLSAMGHGATSAVTQPMGVRWTALAPRFSGGSAGKLNAFAYVQSNPDVMYVGGGWGNTPRESPSQAGIYKTTDGGKHWKTADNGLTNPDGTISSVVNGLWVDQSKPSVVLAATEFGGTFRSTDAGKSWTNVDPAESTQFSQTGRALYLAARSGVLRSTDDGATWTVSLAAAAGATTVVTAGGATYAGTASGDVYRLSGSAWTAAGHAGTGAIHDLAVDPFNTRVVYANVDDAKAWNQNLYATIDGGKRWKRVHCACSIGAQALAASIGATDRIYLGDDGGGWIYYFAADGNPRPTLSRGAQTFGADMRYIIPVAGSGSNDACYFVSDQGLYHVPSCTAGAPTGLSNQIPNALAYDATLSGDATNIVIALQDYSAVSGSGGGSQLHFVNYSGEGGETFLDPYNPVDCYFAHPDDGLYRSVDACKTFAVPAGSGIESLTFDPSTANKLYAVTNADTSGAQVAVSHNGGATWTPTGWAFKRPYQVVVSPADAETILVATGVASSRPHFYYSHDGGATWHEAKGLPQTAFNLNVGLYFPTHRFYAAYAPNAAGTVLLADHDPATDNILLYRSVDNAQSFALVSTLVQPSPPRPWPNLLFPVSDERPGPEIPYYATRFYGNRLAFNPQAPSSATPTVVLTTRFGAFASYDVGSSWSRIDALAIPHHFIGVSWVSGYVYLASFGEGVIKSVAPLQ